MEGPVWLKLKLGANRLEETVKIWDKATGRGVVLTLRVQWVAVSENSLQQRLRSLESLWTEKV